MRRRTFLEVLASTALATRFARAGDDEPLERIELALEGTRRTAKNAVLLLPKHHRRGATLPVLVLLHGLGETRSVAAGLRAWPELYGLVESVARLNQPPLSRIGQCRRCLDDARLGELNRSLEQQPFRGLAVVCPVTPNPRKITPAGQTLDAYAEWIEVELLPKVREHAAIGQVAIDGCSLGGYVALEVFLRRPELFSTVGMVQGAIGPAFIERTARRFAQTVERAGERPVHLLTSSDDIYRAANATLARALERAGIHADLEVGVGAHDQTWLREVGTLSMLLWHDRRLA